MKREIVIIISVLIFVLIIGSAISMIYSYETSTQVNGRVKINKQIIESNIKPLIEEETQSCKSYPCYVYPKVDQSYNDNRLKIPDQTRLEVCNVQKPVKCEEGCFEAPKQEKNSGHMEIPIQTKRIC